METAVCSVQLGLLSESELNEITQLAPISECFLTFMYHSEYAVMVYLLRGQVHPGSYSSLGETSYFNSSLTPKPSSVGSSAITKSISKLLETQQMYILFFIQVPNTLGTPTAIKFTFKPENKIV